MIFNGINQFKGKKENEIEGFYNVKVERNPQKFMYIRAFINTPSISIMSEFLYALKSNSLQRYSEWFQCIPCLER